jgi:hypothetical protein
MLTPKLTTSTEGTQFWAAKSAEFDALLNALDELLPKNAEGNLPFTDETYEDAQEALKQVRLMADTFSGGYARRVFEETTGGVVDHQQGHQMANGHQQYSAQQYGNQQNWR